MGRNSGGVRDFRELRLNRIRKSISAGQKIANVIDDLRKQNYSKIPPFAIGRVEPRMREFVKVNNIDLKGSMIYIRAKDIAHTLRMSKNTKGIAITPKELISFPSKRLKMELYYDNTDGSFVYVDKVKYAKYIIHTNYTIKTPMGKKVTSNYVTATRLKDFKEFNIDKFKKV